MNVSSSEIPRLTYLRSVVSRGTVLHRPGADHLNSLWPSDAIWRQRSGSTLAQVMACCLTAPSHYLNQCWLIISKVQWHSSESNLHEMTQPSVTEITLKFTYLNFCSNLSAANELNHDGHKVATAKTGGACSRVLWQFVRVHGINN